MRPRERERTGIKKLKIGYNQVFGYYIEVTKSYQQTRCRETYIRKQTLTNCERYITQELKELEEQILGAKERIVALEYQLFDRGARPRSAGQLHRIQRTRQAVARLDVLLLASRRWRCSNGYCRPGGGPVRRRSDIKDGRHPVVEQMLKDTPFVPNDTCLDNGGKPDAPSSPAPTWRVNPPTCGRRR